MLKNCVNGVTLERCVLYFFKVAGIATLKFEIKLVKNNEHEEKYILLFKHSKIGIFYNILLISSMIFFTIFTLYRDIIISTNRQLKDDIDTGYMILISSNCVFIWLKFTFQQGKTIALAYDIHRVRNLSIINKNVIDTQSNSLLKSMALIIFVNFTLYLLFLATTTGDINDVFLFTFVYVSLYISNFVLHSLLIQYSFIVMLFKQLFEDINNGLLDFSKQIDVNILRIKRVRNIGNQMTINRLEQMRNSYSSLSKVSKDLSDFYSLPMLFCVFCNFIALIRAGFNLALPLVNRTGVLSVNDYIRFFYYIIHNVASLVVLTKSVTATVDEVMIAFYIPNIVLKMFKTNIDWL